MKKRNRNVIRLDKDGLKVGEGGGRERKRNMKIREENRTNR